MKGKHTKKSKFNGRRCDKCKKKAREKIYGIYLCNIHAAMKLSQEKQIDV